MKKIIIIIIAISMMTLTGCSLLNSNDDKVADLEQQLEDLQKKFDQQKKEIDKKYRKSISPLWWIVTQSIL